MSIRRHSVSINGHRTSISIEDAFWAELKRIAHDEKRSVAALIAAVDQGRGAGDPGTSEAPNLSSALRLYVLAALKSAAAQDGAPTSSSEPSSS